MEHESSCITCAVVSVILCNVVFKSHAPLSAAPMSCSARSSARGSAMREFVLEEVRVVFIKQDCKANGVNGKTRRQVNRDSCYLFPLLLVYLSACLHVYSST